MIKIIIVFLLLNITSFRRSAARKNDLNCSRENCILPSCKCSDNEIPGDLYLSDTPMMIALSFNGIITRDIIRSVGKILDTNHKNPSGCPIQATFFVSDVNNGIQTEYCLVQKLFDNNHEIAVGTTVYE